MLLSVYGVQTAQIPGFVRRLPVEWVATSLCAGVLSLTSWRRSRPAWWVGLAVVVAFVEPLAAWLFLGVSLDDYYPTKIFWHVAALGAPLTAAWCAVGCLSLSRWSERAFAAFLLSRVPHVVVTITVLIGVVGVLPAALGLWSNDGGRILQAATGSEAPQAQVVWHAGKDDTEDWKIQHLVAVYHAGGRFLMRGVPLGTSEQCETLRSVRSPAVLTRASQAEVTAHFKCASGTVSIPVSGFKGLG